MRERACLEAVRDRVVVSGPNLVRTEPLEHGLPAEEEPQVRAEELVRRADEDVGVHGGHVDGAVRRVVHGVDPRESACLVREICDAPHVSHRPDRVRGPRVGDHPGPVRELALEVQEPKRAVLLIDVDEPH